MPRLLRPEVGAAMLARQRSGQTTTLDLQRDVPDGREEETSICAPTRASTSAGEVVSVVGGTHTLAEQWILFKMEVEIDTGADDEHRAPAVLTVREGDVPAEIAAVFVIDSLGLRFVKRTICFATTLRKCNGLNDACVLWETGFRARPWAG